SPRSLTLKHVACSPQWLSNTSLPARSSEVKCEGSQPAPSRMPTSTWVFGITRSNDVRAIAPVVKPCPAIVAGFSAGTTPPPPPAPAPPSPTPTPPPRPPPPPPPPHPH